MHKTESVLENEMNKIHWDSEIQKDHLISARKPDLVNINKRKEKREHLWYSGLCHPRGPQSENQKDLQR